MKITSPKIAHDENDQRDVKREDQIAEVHQHARALRADGMSHRRADPERREHHNVIGELEHDLRKTFHRADHRPSFFADGRYGQREDHGEDNDLKHIAVHHRFDHARRKNVHKRFDPGLGMRLSDRFDDVDVAGSERYADAWPGEIDDRQSNEKRRGGDDLEINQRFDSHASDFSKRAGAGDSDDNGRENQRRDDRLDQVDENVAQEINLVSPIGSQPANQRRPRRDRS